MPFPTDMESENLKTHKVSPEYGTFNDTPAPLGNQLIQQDTFLTHSTGQLSLRGNNGLIQADSDLISDYQPQITINRRVLNQQDLEALVTTRDPSSKRSTSHDNPSRKSCCCSHFSSCFMEKVYPNLPTIPVFSWLPKYNYSRDLLADVVAGVTLAIMQVPQGMAYAMLANVPPVIGLYTSFFPAMIYFLMGTSRHGSIGTFALISMLTNTAMEDVLGELRGALDHNELLSPNYSSGVNGTISTSGQPGLDLEPIEVAVVVAFLVGIIEIAMGLAHLGSLTVLMSDQMISGLITGTAIQVLTSQLKPMTGANISKFSGIFSTVMTWFNFLQHIPNLNWEVVLVTVISLSFLILVKQFLDPVFKKKTKIPFPCELLLIVFATTLSHHFHFKENYNVDIIGNIPTGLVAPRLPHLELIPKLLTGGAMVALIGVSLSLSIVMSYGKKHNYPVDTNQELVAYGLSNAVSSFFSCIPCSISLSRSAVLDSSGGKSQMATLVSCILLLVVILVLGPLFSALPDAVLSSIIVVALRSMLAGVKDLAISWRSSKYEALVWLVTFLGVVILDIDYGLAIGVIFSLVTVLYNAHWPAPAAVLGRLSGTELYVDAQKFNGSVREVKGIKVFNIPGPLYFGNRESFKTHILNWVKSEMEQSAAAASHMNIPVEDLSGSCNSKLSESRLLLIKMSPPEVMVHHIILCCAAVSFVDSGAIETIGQLSNDLAAHGITLFLAGLQDSVIKMFDCCKATGIGKSKMFPTIHDAVITALHGTEDISLGHHNSNFLSLSKTI